MISFDVEQFFVMVGDPMSLQMMHDAALSRRMFGGEFNRLALGCKRPIRSLKKRKILVEDIVALSSAIETICEMICTSSRCFYLFVPSRVQHIEKTRVPNDKVVNGSPNKWSRTLSDCYECDIIFFKIL